jgi:hypothetical protein
MLAILWLCLKVIGILLLVMLLLVLALLLILLFVPVRYRLAGCFEETKKAQAGVSWGAFVFRAKVLYEQEKELFYVIRILGITVLTSEERRTIWDRFLDFKRRREEKKRRKLYGAYQKDFSAGPQGEWDNDAWADLPEGYGSYWEDHWKNDENTYEISYPWDTVDEIEEQEEKEGVVQRVQGFFDDLKKKRSERKEKEPQEEKPLEEPKEKWYNDLEEQVEDLWDKYEKLERFYYENESQYAVRKMLALLKKTVCYILPTRWKGNLRYGFSDPSMTGKTYGILCATGISFAEQCKITPEFQEEVLEGKISARGRLRVFFFVRVAVMIFFDRKLKAVYRKGKDVLGGI